MAEPTPDRTTPDEYGIFDPGWVSAGMPAEPPKVTSKKEVDALAPGAEFIDPTGTKRTKPYTVKDAASYKLVPEGGTFLDPTGTARVKPTYEPLDYWTQTLIEATHGNEAQIERILKGEYGQDTVKREPLTNDFYVEKGGKKYKPGKASITQALASTTALAAPAALGTVGAILGGAGGSVAPGVGTVLGGVGGAALGGAAGEAFNQSILGLAGYAPTMDEYFKNLGREAAYSAGGQMVGGVAAKGVEKVGAATDFGKDFLKLGGGGSFLAKLLGVTKEDAAMAERLASKGALVPPSSWLKEAPKIRMLVEEFDPVFRRQNVLEQSAKAYYDREAPKLLESIGVSAPKTPLTDASAPVSVEPFGETMIRRAQGTLAAADAKFDDAVRAAREVIKGRATGDPKVYQTTLQSLQAAEQEARTAAQTVVDTGFQSIDTDMRNAIKIAQANGNPGDMVRLADEKIKALRAAVGKRAGKLYEAADIAAGETRPDVSGLKVDADNFLTQVPKEFENRYPAIVAAIKRMKEGEATFGQLHQLRSMLRQDVDYNDLTPGVRDGAYRYFISGINKVLFDEAAPPELRAAAELLAKADTFYAKNIAKFRSDSLRWAVDQIEAGVPADPKVLAQRFMQPGQTEEIRMARKVVGKPLWTAVQAADVQAMLEKSKTLIPGEIDGTEFVRQVLQRDRDGILGAAYDPQTVATLREQAQRVLKMQGKMPIQARDGDTLTTLLKRADDLAAEIKTMADKEPVKLLREEMKTFDREIGKLRQQRGETRKKDPLNFLTRPSIGAIQAANNILSKPDLILAVARQYGESGPEFEMLRQVWATRLLQRSTPETAKLAGEFAERIQPEIQQLMFPGLTLDAAQQLAKDMEFLLPRNVTDVGGSIAAKSRVTDPLPKLPLGLHHTLKAIPMADPVARLVLGKYYSMVTWGVTHPAFVRYVAAGLKGNDAMREMAQREFQRSYGEWLRTTGGAVGAGLAPLAITDETPPPKEPRRPPPKTKTWQEIYQEKFGR